MADEVAFFHFGNDAVANAESLARGLDMSVQAVEQAARRVAGTQVPDNFTEGIIRNMERAGREGAEALAKALHPSNLSGKMPVETVRGIMGSNAAGMFQRIQRELTGEVAKLGPEAQKAVASNGGIEKILDQAMDVVIAEIRGAYSSVRSKLDRAVRDNLPTLPQIGRNSLNEAVHSQRLALPNALAERIPGYEDDATYLAAQQGAARRRDLAERAAARAATQTPASDLTQLPGLLYSRASTEDIRRRTRTPGSDITQADGLMLHRAHTEDAKRQEDEDARAQKAGFMVAKAQRLDEERDAKAEAAVRKTASQQIRAYAEDKTRIAREDARQWKTNRAHDRALEEESHRQTTAALTSTIGRRDPYAEGLGYRMSPLTGMPTRKVGGQYADVSNPNDAMEALLKIRELRNAHSETLRLQRDPDFHRIGGGSGRFAAIGDDPATATYYEKQRRGAHDLWVEISGVASKTIALDEAQNAYNKELDTAIARAQRLAAAQIKAQSNQPRSFIAGVKSGAFGSGFNGGGPLDFDAIKGNLGKTVGSAARYSLAYGGFYQFIQSAKDGLAIFEDYQDSFTDYQVALGSDNAVTSEATNGLMELSRALGENVGAAFDAAARGARAFASDADDATKKAEGLATASAAQQVSVIANKSLTDATGDVISVGSAYGMTAGQTDQLLPDWLANAKRNIGGDPTQIAQGLSNFAVTASEAGFTGQEAANIVALIQSRTDESGQAVATRLTRVIQIVSGSTGKSLAADVNRALGSKYVDVTALPKKQLEEFGRAYVEAGKRGLSGIQDQIRAQLGGTGNLKELIPLLEQSGQDQLARALKKSLPGAGASEYQRKIDNLIGSLNKIKGSIQNIVVLAARADIFAPFAIGVKVLEPTLHVLQSILQVYEKLEGVLGPVLGPLGTTIAEATAGVAIFNKLRSSAVATDIAQGTGVAGAVARGVGAGSDVRAAAASNAVAAADERQALASMELTAAELRAAEATNLYSASVARLMAVSAPVANLGAAAGGAWKGIPSWAKLGGLALGGGLLIDAGKQQQDKVDEKRGREMRLLAVMGGRDPREAPTPEKLQTDSDAMRSLSASSTKNISWFQDVNNFFNPSQWRETLQERTRKESDLLHVMSEAGRAEEKRADALKVSTKRPFGDASGRTGDTIDASFKALQEKGASASKQMDAYFQDLMRPPDERLGSWEQPQTTANHVIAALGTGNNQYLSKRGPLLRGGQFMAGVNDSVGTLTAGLGHIPSWMWHAKPGEVSSDIGLGDQMKGMRKRIAAAIKKAGPGLTQDKLMDITSTEVNNLDLSKASFSYSGFDADKYRAQLLKSVNKNVKVLAHQASILKPITPAELQAFITGADAALQEANPADPTAPARVARQNYLRLMARLNATGTAGNARKQAMALYDSRNPMDKPKDQGKLNMLFNGAMRANAGDKAFKDFSQAQVAARNFRHTMRDYAVKEAEDARLAAESRVKGANDANPSAKSKLQSAATRLKYAKVSFRDAGNDVALLEGLMEAMDRKTVMAILGFRKTAVTVARAAYEKSLELLHEAALMLSSTENIIPPMIAPGVDPILGAPGSPDPKEDKKRKHTLSRRQKAFDHQKKILDNAEQGLKNFNEAYNRAAITDESFPGDKNKKDKTPLTAWQQRALRAQALANPNNSIIQARTGLEVARANLAAIKDKHSSEYFSALQAVTQAQWTLASTLGDKATAAANLAAARAGGGQMATARAALQAANIQIRLSDPGSVERLNALTSKASAGWQLRQAAAAKTAAVAAAHASRVGGGIAQARSSLIGAGAQLRSTARGTAEWFQALGSMFDGQRAMREAVVQYKNNLDLLRGDSTDPVEQARDALRAAARKLRSDRHQGKDVKAEDRVAVQDSRNALQRAKFDQRLSDWQTADELGRMSFSKHMSLLDHEHDRLTKIKHRTRQQQDELDEVDKAMKDALNSMDSQFNLGDINVNGLVYQMRRFKAENHAGINTTPRQNTGVVGPNGVTSTQNVTIAINGADVAKVRSIIDGYLGTAPAQRRTTARRKI